ncbi:hypothetical protein RKD18_005887 [Streptomyces phaeoluteigriseus]
MRGKVQGADDEVHGGEPTGGFRSLGGCGADVAAHAFAAEPDADTAAAPRRAQNRTLMNAPTSWKPTLRYVRRAVVLKSLT